VGREINYRNPYGSLPSPQGKDIPVTLWTTQTGVPVAWQGLDGNGNDNGLWDTPVFDLRPDLRSAQGSTKFGVPIWDTEARLYIQVFGLLGAPANTTGLRLGCMEFANCTLGTVTMPQPPRAVAPLGGGFPAQVGRDPVVAVTPVIDITSELMFGTNQTNSVVMVFAPLGEGYPVRYWKLRLVWFRGQAVGPALSIQAAVY